MIRFIGDMIIGWIVFTPSGKKVANKLVNKAFNTIKKNVMNNSDLKELMSIKDIFINEESNDEKPNSNNRTKN
jgi:hypothetical protein